MDDDKGNTVLPYIIAAQAECSKHSPVEFRMCITDDGLNVRGDVSHKYTANGRSWGCDFTASWEHLATARVNPLSAFIAQYGDRLKHLLRIGSWPDDPEYSAKLDAGRRAGARDGTDFRDDPRRETQREWLGRG